MTALTGIEPKEVFGFFEDICNIPHGSQNLQKISDFLVDFAKERGLEVRRDKSLNVIIKAPGTEGYEDKEPVILQGHMDMVAVKESDCDIDLAKDGLRVKTDGEYIWAEGTSLGGDDGIAVAYILAILDSKDIPHPPLEIVITTDEEIGMIGAAQLDLSDLKSKKMINIDNEEEGVFITSCAGGSRFNSKLPVTRIQKSGVICRISVSGLQGGHSGEMIQYGRGNSNIICNRVISSLLDVIKINVISIDGGVADNAIPTECESFILVDEKDLAKAKEIAIKTFDAIKCELELKDPGLVISFAEKGKETVSCMDDKSTENLVKLIEIMPDGVQAMSAAIDGLVETSLNMGIVQTSEDSVLVVQALRSSVEPAFDELDKKLEIIANLFGCEIYSTGRYPGWQYRSHSELRDHMVSIYKKLYGKEPKLEAIHAGLECGIIGKLIDGLDCISIGPDMKDIHSTNEKLSVKSTANVWEYLKMVLAEF